jgi:hypothetical protein
VHLLFAPVYSSSYPFLRYFGRHTRFLPFFAIMPPSNILKRARKPASRPAKRRKTSASGTASQLVIVDASQPSSFELELRKTQLEDVIAAPTIDGSDAAIATINDGEDSSNGGYFEQDQADSFDGIDSTRLPLYCKPLVTQLQQKSWVYQYGYRVTSLAAKGRKLY